MPKRVFKYPIALGANILDLKGAILHYGIDPKGDLCVWAIHDEAEPLTHVNVVVTGTGHALPKWNLEHIGSVVQGDFVWHAFVVRP